MFTSFLGVKYMKSKKLEGRVRMDLSDGDLLISSVEKILK